VGASRVVRKCIAWFWWRYRPRGVTGVKWGGVFQAGSDLRREHELFRRLGRQRSFTPTNLGSSSNGENGEPFHVPHQLGWGRRVNRGLPASILGDTLIGLFLRGLALGWLMAMVAGIFAEITGRRPGADSRRPKCSLGAFLGRERQRAVNRWRAAVNRARGVREIIARGQAASR